VGLYAKYILPRLIDAAMKSADAESLRAESIPAARGEVLEVGIGSGLNLPFYSRTVSKIYGVDPSLELQQRARARMTAATPPVEFLAQSAEAPLPFSDQSMDTVVCTWSLCSILDPARALQQMKRVLKPEGIFIFIEHGRSPDPGVVSWQNRLNPLWSRVTGGCNLNRQSDAIIRAAGFQIESLKTHYLPGPRPMTYTYQGTATNP
jgi:ubiquinone/menaquinone biosynthesis C-methylase UbiE